MQEWKFYRTVDESNENFLQRRIVFDAFVRVKTSFQLMREYSELFGVWDDG